MIVRKTLKQAIAEGGYIDREKFESFTDADIERMIDEDLDPALQAPLRILDRIPETALRALDEPARKAG